MNILDQYQGKINGVFSFFDRMIFKGYIIQFYSTSGKKHFLSHNNILLKDFASYAHNITQQLCDYIQHYTIEQNRSVIYLASPKVSKEQTALKERERLAVKEGLICTISTVETCSTLQAIGNKETQKLELKNVNRKCKYYYLYYQDKIFGFMHAKIQTWFPFQMQIYINGREMMKSMLSKNNISYTMYDNSFVALSDVEKAQKLADQFDSKKLCRMLDKYAHTLNPYLKTIEQTFSNEYYWCVEQCEYATDIMFQSREDLEDIYPSLVERAFYSFKCEDVFSFMGRKLTAQFLGEVVSDYRKRPEGFRVKHKMKSNSLKMYDKFNVLRIEMTINDPKEFKIRKKVQHRDGTESWQWKPMGKSIANLYRYAEVAKASNSRYIAALNNIIPKGNIEKELNALCERTHIGDKVVAGFNLWEKQTVRLFTEVANASFLIRGFTNQNLRHALWPSELADKPFYRNKTTRLIAKLRAHKLIRKVPRSSRYFLSDKGRRITSALIQIRSRQYPELVA
jgi:hypothetical protein